jgi:hypothetical protein
MDIVLFDAFVEGCCSEGALRMRSVVEPHCCRMRAATVRYCVAFLRWPCYLTMVGFQALPRGGAESDFSALL